MPDPAVRHFDILTAFLLDDHIGIDFSNGVMSLGLYGFKVDGDSLLPTIVKHLIRRIGVYERDTSQTTQQIICQSLLFGGNAHIGGITHQFTAYISRIIDERLTITLDICLHI